MNSKLVTSCLLAGALLLPMAGYTSDNGQTDPGYVELWLMPPYTADRGQTDPGYIAPKPLAGYSADGDTAQIEIEIKSYQIKTNL